MCTTEARASGRSVVSSDLVVLEDGSEESASSLINDAKGKDDKKHIEVNNNVSDKWQKLRSSYHKNCFTSSEPNKAPYKKNLDFRHNDFLNRLDAKLRILQEEKKRERMKRTESQTRPLFITTVKTGVFLEPPPELAALLGLRSTTNSSSSGSLKSGDDGMVYSFSSQPRILNNKLPKKKLNTNNNNNSTIQNNNTLPKINRAKREIPNNNNNVIKNNNLNKKKDEPTLPYGNIMFDRRVVRGPAHIYHPVQTSVAESQAARVAEAKRRAVARRKAQTQRVRALKLRLGTPPPVEGRKHEDIQTEDYLEELADHPVEVTIGTQTDFQYDRPPTPEFVPAKRGVDTATQIYPGELFHFDTEVTPILEVLVGKTLEQSLVEVFQEDELESLRIQQRRFQEARDAEKAEVQRLEEMERRKREEIERRTMEEQEAAELQKQTEDRVAAAVLTTGYISDLLPTIVTNLKEAGYIKDDVQEDIEDNFMSWLLSEVKAEMERMVTNRDLLSEMVREILESRAEIYRALGEKAAEKLGIESEPEDDVSPKPSRMNLGELEFEDEPHLKEDIVMN